MNRVERIIAFLKANQDKIEGISVGSIRFDFAYDNKLKPTLTESHPCIKPVDNNEGK